MLFLVVSDSMLVQFRDQETQHLFIATESGFQNLDRFAFRLEFYQVIES